MNTAIFLLVLVLPFIGPSTLLSPTSAAPSSPSPSGSSFDITAAQGDDNAHHPHVQAESHGGEFEIDSPVDTVDTYLQSRLPLPAIVSTAERRQHQPLVPLVLCSVWSRVRTLGTATWWPFDSHSSFAHSSSQSSDLDDTDSEDSHCHDPLEAQQHAMLFCPCSKPRKPKQRPAESSRARGTRSVIPPAVVVLASEPTSPEEEPRSPQGSSAKFRSHDDTSLFINDDRNQQHAIMPPSSASMRSVASRARTESTMSSSNTIIKTVPPVAFDHVRILTYNFFLRPPFISDYNGDSKEERLTSFISEVLPRYDIIALQETFSGYSSRVHRLEKAATRTGFLAHARGPKGSMVAGHLLDAGLLVLSRWPIHHSSRLTFSRGVTVDRLASKGATYTLHVHPERPNVRLHLINTHLQASYSTAPKLDDPSVECRRQQIKELVAFITEQVGAHWPAAAGDSASVDMTRVQPMEEQQENVRAKRDPAVVPPFKSPADVPLPPSPEHASSPLDLGSISHPDTESADSPTLAPASTASATTSSTATSATVTPPGPSSDSTAAAATYDMILVCGDLNVNSLQSPPEEYEQMLNLFSANGRFSVTDVLAAEGKQDYTQLPWVWFSKHRRQHGVPPRDAFAREGGRLDYILLLEPRSEMSHAVETKVDKCEVDHVDFSQLSDHMGVAAHVTLPKLG